VTKSLQILLDSIADESDVDRPRIGNSSVSRWIDISDFGDCVRTFLIDCYPTGGLDGPFYSILPSADLQEHNESYVPGCFVLPYGFVTFGSKPNGDALAVEGLSGEVVLLSHESIGKESISQSWTPSTGVRPDLSLSKANLLATALERYADPEAFFREWLRLIRMRRGK
jgi:hypothetical protein